MIRGIGFAKIGHDVVADELSIFKERMDSIGVEFFLVAGLCLGLVRDGKPIEYDKDFDFGVMNEADLQRVIDEIGHFYEEVGIDNRYVQNGAILWLKRYIGDYCLPMELQAHYVRGESVYYNRALGKTWKFNEARLVWPRHLFENFAKTKFNGVELNVPNPPEEFLKIHYGSDWKTPKEYTDWRYYCKNIQQGYWM